MTPAEAAQIEFEETHGFEVDLACLSCGHTWGSRDFDGELQVPDCPLCGMTGARL